ncbi:hypothetical protein L7F22_028179 [Adiantum nelumboides]|nr:hypothetical protein [Adiantum nelumboides]
MTSPRCSAPYGLLICIVSTCAILLSGTSAQEQCGSGAGGALCANNLCCSKSSYCGSTDAYCGDGCQSGPCTSSGGSPPSTPSGGGSVSSIVSSSLFDQFLSQRTSGSCPSNGFYTYDAFISATAAYSSFATSSSDAVVNKREVAAFFANVAHETGSGCYVEEIAKSTYCEVSAQWSCNADKQYYGRGPLQLTWNYNYGAAGQALGFDGINNPDIVAQDPNISFETALWFWMTQRSPTCHDAIVNGQGFGATINAINGGIECGSGANQEQQQARINLYKSFCSLLGVEPGDNLTC